MGNAAKLDAMELVRRCEKVGWHTEFGSAGVKVTNDEGNTMVVHLTVSEPTLKQMATRLNKLGLAKAEREARTVSTLKAAAAQEKHRAEAEQKLRAAEQAAAKRALVKAAGPYLTEAEDVPYAWFAEKHPAPWMRWVKMTPALAKQILENHNTANRPRNERQIEHYARIILSGQWHLTHQGGAMDSEGILQDCQHRLYAIESFQEHIDNEDLPEDFGVPMAFFVGMSPDNFKAIDEGLLRTAGQLFARNGQKYGSAIQAVIRLVAAYRNGDGSSGARTKVTNEQVLDMFDENAEEFEKICAAAHNQARGLSLTRASLGSAIFLIREANGRDNPYVEAFFSGLITGYKSSNRVVLDDLDPRTLVRRTLVRYKEQKKKVTSIDQVGMVIVAWNNLIANYRTTNMKYNFGQRAPEIHVCPPTSAVPEMLYGEVKVSK